MISWGWNCDSVVNFSANIIIPPTIYQHTTYTGYTVISCMSYCFYKSPAFLIVVIIIDIGNIDTNFYIVC